MFNKKELIGLTSAYTVFAATNVSAQLVGAAASRQVVIVCAPASSRVTVSNQTPAIIDEGATITAGQQPFIFDRGQFATVVTGVLNGVLGAVGPVNVSVWSVSG